MKLIPIKNIAVLTKLDKFAEFLLRQPHTYKSLPQPDLTFARLKTLMADGTYKGFPDTHNYCDYAGKSINNYKLPNPGHQRKTVGAMKENFLDAVNNIDGAKGEWYWDTVAVMMPKYGHTGWTNSKNKPRHSLRFIYNSDDGYSIGVVNKKQITIKDQNNTIGTGNWTCIATSFPEDGSQWFGDCNIGDNPRVVFDISIQWKDEHKYNKFLTFIQNY